MEKKLKPLWHFNVCAAHLKSISEVQQDNIWRKTILYSGYFYQYKWQIDAKM